jgi:hypothetical protein
MSAAAEAFNTMLTVAHGITKGVLIVAPGINPARAGREIGAEVNRLATHGRAELAQALFSQSNAYVPYGAGQQLTTQQQQHMRQQARGRSL